MGKETMKMGTLMSVLCLVFCLNELVANKLEKKKIVLSGSNCTIECLFDVEYPSWTCIYNKSYYEDITISGIEMINPKFHARERIKYDDNKKDIEVSNVTKRDAGKYLCSKAFSQPRQSTVEVEVLTPEDWVMSCPDDKSDIMSITTDCFTQKDIKMEWAYISVTDDTKVTEVYHSSETKDCSAGKAQIVTRGFFTRRADSTGMKVHILFNLTFNSLGQPYSVSRKCSSQDYYIKVDKKENCEYHVVQGMKYSLVMSIILLIYGSQRIYWIYRSFRKHQNLVKGDEKRLLKILKDKYEITLTVVAFVCLLVSCVMAIYSLAIGLDPETCNSTAESYLSATFILLLIGVLLLLCARDVNKTAKFLSNMLQKRKTKDRKCKHPNEMDNEASVCFTSKAEK